MEIDLKKCYQQDIDCKDCEYKNVCKLFIYVCQLEIIIKQHKVKSRVPCGGR